MTAMNTSKQITTDQYCDERKALLEELERTSLNDLQMLNWLKNAAKNFEGARE